MEKNELLELYAQEVERNRIIKRAFELACKCLRDHPPIDTCDHVELVQCVINSKNDPEGKRWMAKFLLDAEKELKGEKEGIRQ